MDIIVPNKIEYEDIITYNVPMDVAIWSSSTTYSKGAVVTRDVCGQVRYESLINSNVGIPPDSDDGTNWLKLDQPANCFSMFSTSHGQPTVGDASIDDGDIKIKFISRGKLGGFGFINLKGVREVYVKITRNDGVTVVYENTKKLLEKSATGWWDWLFGEFRGVLSFIDFGFTPSYGSTIEVEFRSYPNMVSSVGSFVYGFGFEIGQTTYGASLELKDFSTFTEDEFGNYTIVPRVKSKRPSYPVIVDESRVNIVFRTLEKLSNQPILWIPSKTKLGELSVLGFYRNLRIDISTPAWTAITLTINGVQQ